MKKILSLVICILVFGSMATAVPNPKYRKNKNARIVNGKTLPPKPEHRRR